MTIQDPLKSIENIAKPDPRYEGSPWTLEKHHADLEEIRLHQGCSIHVRQLFETAKNVSLYSWYVYRFHMVARVAGYTCLERALKERLAREDSLEVENVRATLGPLMILARDRSWLRSENFSSVRCVARVQLMDMQTIQMISDGEIGDEPVEIPEISDADIWAHAAKLDYVPRIAASMPFVRNHIAHGGSIVDGSSAATLRVVAECTNQLFQDPNVKDVASATRPAVPAS